jgi:predicted nucleic acid-binding protein
MHDAVIDRLDEGTFRRVELTRDVHRRAEHLLNLATSSLRAADALHLALAVWGRAASMASFDVKLSAAARAVGLATYPV